MLENGAESGQKHSLAAASCLRPNLWVLKRMGPAFRGPLEIKELSFKTRSMHEKVESLHCYRFITELGVYYGGWNIIQVPLAASLEAQGFRFLFFFGGVFCGIIQRSSI